MEAGIERFVDRQELDGLGRGLRLLLSTLPFSR